MGHPLASESGLVGRFYQPVPFPMFGDPDVFLRQNAAQFPDLPAMTAHGPDFIQQSLRLLREPAVTERIAVALRSTTLGGRENF
jgi:hypothetical protein